MFTHIAMYAIFFSIFVNVIADTYNLVATVENGKILGSVMKTARGRDIYSFRGIPYAKPPVGDLRFKKPESIGPWPDILDAAKDGPKCTQFDASITKTSIGEEDCLVLNVYVPKIGYSSFEHNKLPVMVFIHGGGFVFGDSSTGLYGPQKLLDQDIILVTFNYRLGVLGFLSAGDSELPGNFGLFDQIEALKWVNKNIKYFGGDPNRVTIFGNSAGGASVAYHLLSPLSKNFFHSAIIQSGSPLNSWAFQETPRSNAKRLALKLNCPVYNSKVLVECLKTKSVEELVRTAYEIFAVVDYYGMNLTPVVDGDFLPDQPANLLGNGIINRVPTIIGVNKDEGALTYASFQSLYDLTSEGFLKEDLAFILPLFLHGIEDNATDVAKEFVKYYYKGVNFSDKKATQISYLNLLSDCTNKYPIEETRNLLVQAGIPIFAYIFSYRGAFSFTNLLGYNENIGVSHADELIYLFDGIFYDNNQGDDKNMSDLMIKIWTTFAETKNPTPTETFEFEWKPISNADEPNYLDLSLHPCMKTGRLTENVDFLRKVLPAWKNSLVRKNKEM